MSAGEPEELSCESAGTAKSDCTAAEILGVVNFVTSVANTDWSDPAWCDSTAIATDASYPLGHKDKMTAV